MLNYTDCKSKDTNCRWKNKSKDNSWKDYRSSKNFNSRDNYSKLEYRDSESKRKDNRLSWRRNKGNWCKCSRNTRKIYRNYRFRMKKRYWGYCSLINRGLALNKCMNCLNNTLKIIGRINKRWKTNFYPWLNSKARNLLSRYKFIRISIKNSTRIM